jgi:phage terminase small subunit
VKGGHNRAPTAVKKLRGTQRKDRTNASAPLVSPKLVPKPPRGLSKVQVRVWKELAPQVEHLGVFTRADQTAFRLLVEVVSETRSKTFREESGTARVRMLQVAASMLNSFGLNPASHERVNGQPPARPLPDEDEDQPQQEEETPLFGLRSIPGGAAAAGGGGG